MPVLCRGGPVPDVRVAQPVACVRVRAPGLWVIACLTLKNVTVLYSVPLTRHANYFN